MTDTNNSNQLKQYPSCKCYTRMGHDAYIHNFIYCPQCGIKITNITEEM